MLDEFDIAPDAMVVTTTYVLDQGMPILYVAHDADEEDVLWQFHCGNGDYSGAVLRLVRLDQMLRRDPTLGELAPMPIGYSARRSAVGQPWIIDRD